MAMTAEGRALTRAHRVAQVQVGAAAAAIVDASWGLLDLSDLDASTPAWLAVVLGNLQSRYATSQSVAQAYLREYRSVELGSPDGPTAAPNLNAVAAGSALTSAGPILTKVGIRDGLAPADAFQVAKRTVYGQFQVWSMDGGRDTLAQTARVDQRSRRLRRVTDGNPCAFCAMLVARSIQMPGSMPADFKTHPHCGCTNEVVYGPADEQRINDTEWEFVEAYEQAAQQAREAGEPVVAPSKRRRRDTVLWRMRRNRPDLFNDGVHAH